MKVAKKSPANRATLTVSAETYRAINALAQDRPLSTWISDLVIQETRRQKRQKLAQRLESQYTEKVCAETLQLNQSLPVHEA